MCFGCPIHASLTLTPVYGERLEMSTKPVVVRQAKTASPCSLAETVRCPCTRNVVTTQASAILGPQFARLQQPRWRVRPARLQESGWFHHGIAEVHRAGGRSIQRHRGHRETNQSPHENLKVYLHGRNNQLRNLWSSKEARSNQSLA